ncbi:alpha-glucan water dikinase 2-like [Helianthus annuus]|uniref:alpha-glucan water dikinase 2-like n=1 Tax=Helianthus annuus TaxID=4232 RepID=UPI001653155D|nr:alpha-glucan water dikinase 2-like [Helianthus annuus]
MKVWASKQNERAYFSTRKVKLDHDLLCMAVLVQEIINADYAFIIHTTNPSSGDPSEIYAEVVKGLGETLVGAYLGRALSFISKKDKLDSPKKGPEDSEAVKLKPTFADAYLNLGNVYKALVMAAEAIVCYQRALQSKPDYAMAYDDDDDVEPAVVPTKIKKGSATAMMMMIVLQLFAVSLFQLRVKLGLLMYK